MASLSQTTGIIRKIAIGFLIFTIAVLGIDTFIQFQNSIDNPFNQVPSFYQEPQNGFGTLPEPPLNSLPIAEDSNPRFAINQEFPKHPNTAFVYSIEEPRSKFNTVENAVKTAETLGFTQEYTENGNILTWKNTAKTRTLTFNKLTEEWDLNTQYFLDPLGQRPKSLQESKNYYTGRMSSALNRLGFDDQSLQDGKITATLSKLGPDGLFSQAQTLANGEYVTLDVKRSLQLSAIKPESQWTDLQQQVENPPETQSGLVYKESPQKGSLRAVVSDDMQPLKEDMYSLEYTSFNYKYNGSTYEIVSPEEAWEKVRSGKGYLVSSKLKTDDFFSDNRVLSVERFVADAPETELGYYEPEEWAQSQYVFPIYIFRGRIETLDGKTGEFVFYADALRRFEEDS